MKDLQVIPGVGKETEKDLHLLGIHRVEDLKGKSPEKLYDKLCKIQNTKLDRCVLYVMRCAVYFASNKTYDPELLKWWNWKE